MACSFYNSNGRNISSHNSIDNHTTTLRDSYCSTLLQYTLAYSKRHEILVTDRESYGLSYDRMLTNNKGLRRFSNNIRGLKGPTPETLDCGHYTIRDFPKIRVPYFGVLILIRILLFRVPY